MHNISKEVETLKKQLNYFLFKYDKPIVISLQGYWGIGKTYFWNDYIKSKSKEDKQVVYISLFGINKLDDIKSKIILSISKREKIAKKIKKILGTSRLLGVELSSVLSIIDKKSIEDIIICFDDFERISPNLSISDVLGFISELKEQYKCKIIMINNNEILREQDELYHQKIIKSLIEKGKKKEKIKYFITSTNNFEIFEKFSEKIIDINLRYEPSIDDLINIVKNDNNKYIDFVLVGKLFNGLKDKNKKFNLRLLNQLILKLEVIKDILENSEILMCYKNGLIYEIFSLIVKEVFTYDNFNFSNIERGLAKNELNTLIQKHQFDVKKVKDTLIKRTKEISKEKEIKTHKDNIKRVYDKYLYDMSYENSEFENDFFALLQDDKFDKVAMNLHTLSEYIQLLVSINKDEEAKYKIFYLNKIKEYLKARGVPINRFGDSDDSFVQAIYVKWLDKEDELKVFIEDLQEESKDEIDEMSIIELIEKILKSNRYDDDIENKLAILPTGKHEKLLLENHKYFQTIYDFMKWIQRFSGDKPFKDFYEETLDIYKKLKIDVKYKHKIEVILKSLNIDDFDSSEKKD